MASPITNYATSNNSSDGTILRDYRHAALLYRSNFYELAPKAGWIYYVVININSQISSVLSGEKQKYFDSWYQKYQKLGSIGLLAKTVDTPKFTINTETMNQYNRKSIIQKSITYNPLSITFHDDMANATTDFWKHYYQYYFGDSNDVSRMNIQNLVIPKYTDTKYQTDDKSYAYGLNNGQTIPFMLSIDIFQLYKHHYTGFRIVNPIIKDWSHDQLDQTQGNKMLTSRMSVEYETVIYDTDQTNVINEENPGFNNSPYYDQNPSPIGVGSGNNTDANEIFPQRTAIQKRNPSDALNETLQGRQTLGGSDTGGAAGGGPNLLDGLIGNTRRSTSSAVGLDGSVSSVPSVTGPIRGTGSATGGVGSPAGVILGGGGINVVGAVLGRVVQALPRILGR